MIELDARYLKAMLVCIPSHDVRYYFCGMQIKAVGGRVEALAADGHRLSKWLVSDDFEGKDFEFLIKKETIWFQFLPSNLPDIK